MKTGLIALLSNIFGFIQVKEERKAKKEAILNQDDFKTAQKKANEAARKDQNEKLIDIINNSSDPSLRAAALEEIRKRLGQ